MMLSAILSANVLGLRVVMPQDPSLR